MRGLLRPGELIQQRRGVRRWHEDMGFHATYGERPGRVFDVEAFGLEQVLRAPGALAVLL